MAKVVIFGVKDTAELAHFYLTHDTEHEVVAFTVHQDYIEDSYFKGLPVVAFENIENYYPSDKFKMFAPMTAKNMNRLRESVYDEVTRKGYEFVSYISSKATVYDESRIGKNCFILEDNTIQPFTSIGNNVVLWSGNHIGHHSNIGDHVFITSQVVLSGHCNVANNCFFGVNSTIKDYSNIAEGTLVGMGACVTKNTQEWGVYVGNPAKLRDVKSYDIY
jgi:sugar O-acyltransferase (sialic acid O-acetyltransferase NeuD family)